MLNNITWYQYILYTFSVLGIYYCYVLVVYYRKDLPKIFSKKSAIHPVQSQVPKKASSPKKAPDLSDPEVIEQLFSQAMELSDGIKGIFQEISYQEGDSEELFHLLRQKISNYELLYQTPFMVAINNLIITEAEKYQFEIEDKEAINELWVRGYS